MWGNAGWLVCRQCPMLCTSFFLMINDRILRRKSWVRERVPLRIQLPLSGLVVRGTALGGGESDLQHMR